MVLLPRDEIVQLVRINSAWDGMQERCGTRQGSIDDMLGFLLRKNHGKNGCNAVGPKWCLTPVLRQACILPTPDITIGVRPHGAGPSRTSVRARA